jgi:hypothetical protein
MNEAKMIKNKGISSVFKPKRFIATNLLLKKAIATKKINAKT